MDNKKWVIILAVLGVLVAGYLSYMHYSSNYEICNIDSTWDCGGVSQSDYSEFMGIPIAYLGFVAYLVILLFALWNFKWVKWISLFGTLFSLRLTWAEAFIIHKYCYFCLLSQLIILAIFIFSVKWKKLRKN